MPEIPTVKFGDIDITRLIVGGNPFCGNSHLTPAVSGEMVEFVHHGVTLDRCNDCDGLYFDAGELEEVLRAEYPDEGEAPEEEEEAPEAGSFAEDEDTQVDVPTKSKSGFFRTLFSRKREEKSESQ